MLAPRWPKSARGSTLAPLQCCRHAANADASIRITSLTTAARILRWPSLVQRTRERQMYRMCRMRRRFCSLASLWPRLGLSWPLLGVSEPSLSILGLNWAPFDLPWLPKGNAGQGKARQGKTRQGKARQGKATQDQACLFWVRKARRPIQPGTKRDPKKAKQDKVKQVNRIGEGQTPPLPRQPKESKTRPT